MKLSKKGKIIVGISLVAVVLLVVLGIVFYPQIRAFSLHETLYSLESWVASYGNVGFFILLGIQVLQIVVAIIPGGPIQIAAGVLFGTFGGFLLCFVGTVIGTVIVFYLVRKFGQPLVIKMVGQKQFDSVKFMKDAKKLEMITFLLYLVPGAPKDALTYVAALTTIDPKRFFIISSVARVPALLTSIWAGASITKGNLWAFVIMIVVIGAIGVVSILFHDKIMQKIKKHK